MRLSANPLELLHAEHVMILRACDEAEAISHSILRGDKATPDTIVRVSRFFSDYVATRHRYKEERLVFPIVERAYGPEVTATSLRDHEEGCWWTRSLDQIARAASSGCRLAERRWAETATRYIAIVRAQIEGEERSVFPLAESAITPVERRDLCVAFEETDREVAA